MKKTFFFIFGAVFALMLSIYLIMVMTLNYQKILADIKNSMKESGYEATTNSIDIVHFPIPRIVVGNLSVQSMDPANKSTITSENVIVSLSVLSLLTLNPAIGSIESSKAVVTTLDTDITKHGVLLHKLQKLIFMLPEVRLRNVELKSLNSSSSAYLDSVDLKPKASFNNIILHWNKNTQTNISFSDSKAPYTAVITTLSPNHKMELSEEYSDQWILTSGHLDYKIHNLKDYVENEYPEINLMVTDIASTESMNITSDIASDNDSIFFKNINIASSSVEAKGSARFFNDGNPSSLDLSIMSMNLNNLLSNIAISSTKGVKKKSSSTKASMNLEAHISCNNLLLKDMSINSLNLNFVTSNNGSVIKDLSFVTSDGGKFSANGVVTNNQYRAKFDGKITASHPDTNLILSKLGFNNAATQGNYPLYITSEIAASPIDYQLNNLVTKVGDFSVEGNATLKLIGDTPRVGITAQISPIDVASKEYPVVSPIISYFSSLSDKMQEKDYSNKYIPLRKIDYIGNFDITLLQPYFKEHQLNKIHITTDVSAGIVDLTTIYYQDGANYIRGAGRLVTSSLKPTLDIVTVEGSLSTPAFSLDDLLASLALSYSKYAFDKVGLNFNVNLNHLNIGDLSLNNVAMATNSTDSVLWKISNLNASYGSGKFISSGSLLLDSLTLNLAYAYNNFQTKDLNIIYPLEIFGIKDGWVSSNGTIVTTGLNTAQWVYNMSVASDFVAQDVLRSNYDIDGFAIATDSVAYDSSRIDEDLKKYMNSGEMKIANASGGFSLDHGVVKISNVKFKTARASGALSAAYNLYNSTIDAKTDLSFLPVSLDPYNVPKPVHVNINAKENIVSPKLELIADEVKSMIDSRKKSQYYQAPNSIQGDPNAQSSGV
ncbi:MAG: hypothetical protein RLZZ59_545 [Pseudomonadota bacterium]|jgi:hypothetical protein